MSLSSMVISAVMAGGVVFNDALPNQRFCRIGDLRFVRVCLNDRWNLIVGSSFHHIGISWAAHLALEYARMGWESRCKQEGGAT